MRYQKGIQNNIKGKSIHNLIKMVNGVLGLCPTLLQQGIKGIYNVATQRTIFNVSWGAVAQWLERWTLNLGDKGSTPLASASKLGQFCSLHTASVHSAV